MTAGSSPGTSEIASVSTGAGQAASASRPPLIADRCLRTQLISPMLAPERSSAAVSARFSASVMPAAGAASRAEPPPEISASTRSCCGQPRNFAQNARRRRLARRIRHRVRRLDDLDALARHAVAVAGDDQAVERPRPMILDRPRHRRRGLAGADHDQPPAIVRRQMRRHAQGRIGSRDGGVEQAAQHRARIHPRIPFGNQPRPASVAASGLYSQPTQPS